MRKILISLLSFMIITSSHGTKIFNPEEQKDTSLRVLFPRSQNPGFNPVEVVLASTSRKIEKLTRQKERFRKQYFRSVLEVGKERMLYSDPYAEESLDVLEQKAIARRAEHPDKENLFEQLDTLYNDRLSRLNGQYKRVREKTAAELRKSLEVTKAYRESLRIEEACEIVMKERSQKQVSKEMTQKRDDLYAADQEIQKALMRMTDHSRS